MVLQPDAASNAAHTDAEMILLIQTLLLPPITTAKAGWFWRNAALRLQAESQPDVGRVVAGVGPVGDGPVLVHIPQLTRDPRRQRGRNRDHVADPVEPRLFWKLVVLRLKNGSVERLSAVLPAIGSEYLR